MGGMEAIHGVAEEIDDLGGVLALGLMRRMSMPSATTAGRSASRVAHGADWVWMPLRVRKVRLAGLEGMPSANCRQRNSQVSFCRLKWRAVKQRAE